MHYFITCTYTATTLLHIDNNKSAAISAPLVVVPSTRAHPRMAASGERSNSRLRCGGVARRQSRPLHSTLQGGTPQL